VGDRLSARGPRQAILCLLALLWVLASALPSAAPADAVLAPGRPLLRGASAAEARARTSALVDGPDPRIGVDQGARSLAKLQRSLAGTDRVTFSWAALEPNGPSSFQPQFYAPSPDQLAQETSGGVEAVGLIQFTPAWAARAPGQGERSVPRGLGDPDGPWSQFVRRLVSAYHGQVHAWIIWNEMDFQPGDSGAGGSWTWGGSEADYWQLLKDAYRAVKSVDPSAMVLFGATSYWDDVENHRPLFLRRVLQIAASDPEAAANHWFFDAVAMNVYRSPDDIYRVGAIVHDLLAGFSLARPQWLTETNCMPWDDPLTPKPDDAQRCTLNEQAAFVVQAYAIGLAAPWARVLWYQLTDAGVWQAQEAWGLVRDDGSERPALLALRTAATYFSHADRVTFSPLPRQGRPWADPWPDDPGSYYPDWQVYQVVVDRGPERILVLWNADGQPLRVRVPKQGSHAVLVDKLGGVQPLADDGAWYTLTLPAATAVGPADPPGYYYVGGDPALVVQEDVPSGAVIGPPVLAP